MLDRLQTLLVDDEPLALDSLRSLLSAEPDIDIVASCRNGKEALHSLRTTSIDLVFLDVHMPAINGLEVVAQLQADVFPMIVFVTAFDRFALEAFELNAVDYLLKPLDPARLQLTLERVRQRQRTETLLHDKGAVVNAMGHMQAGRVGNLSEGPTTETKKLPIKDGSETHLVDIKDIDWIDAAGDYMCVHVAGETHILRSTMKELERRLSGQFARIHRSTIANMDKVQRVVSLPKGESRLYLSGDVTLKVSRNYREAIRHLLT